MGYIAVNSETLDLILIDAKRIPVLNESAQNLLDGSWFIQTIGNASEKLIVRALCPYTVYDALNDCANAKDNIAIEFMNVERNGIIIGPVDYEIVSPGSDPMCEVNFEMAVMPDV